VTGVVACVAPTPTLGGFDTAQIEVGEQRLTVTVAETTSQRSQGLRGVETLPEGIDGMLFAFGDPTTATFGMRDTLIPLEIWWFDGEGRILGSTRMEPCFATPCTGYASPGEIAWALETPSGEVHFAPGDTLKVIGAS
jgi:hypothetical protein